MKELHRCVKELHRCVKERPVKAKPVNGEARVNGLYPTFTVHTARYVRTIRSLALGKRSNHSQPNVREAFETFAA